MQWTVNQWNSDPPVLAIHMSDDELLVTVLFVAHMQRIKQKDFFEHRSGKTLNFDQILKK